MLELATGEPRLLDPASFAAMSEQNPIPAYPPHPWPVLVTPAETRVFAEQSIALNEIAGTVLRRFFAGDPARIAAFYGIEGGAALVELVLAEPNGLADAISRGDYIVTRDGLRCVEINAGTGVSGWRIPTLWPLYAGLPPLAEALRREGLALRSPETFGGMLAHFVRGALALPSLAPEEEINTVIAVRRGEDAAHRAHSPESQEHGRRLYAAALAEAAPGRRGGFAFCDYTELELRGGSAWRQGRRVHALFEQHADGGPVGRQLFGSFKAGKLALYTGPVSRILMDKRNLALLSEHQDGELFDEAERRLLRAVVPWTRRLLREATDYRGERVFLPELCAAERERLVLKRAFSHSGKDVYLGRDTPAAEWDERVAAALAEEDRWVVQEALESLRYELLDEELGVVPHDAVWGLFAFGGRFHGGFLRVAPRERRCILNVSQGARVLPYLEMVEE